ncbi:hypothetical protein F0562_000379 [Nyssa sinensis]|uniref:Cation-transporting P-type ATPase N-terminal domain-containing protein n=1 Tax=Nyssa sinensis TaxID=561372 RepID=A0A5J5BZZ1_9ASTE|nr:hypothetical protein F0562_000379 [Nyssa sinensis]
MTTICNADPRCIELIILDLPTILSKSNKNGWQKAFATVRCLRAFSSLFKEVVAKNKSKLYPSPSQTALVIDIAEVETHPCFSNIDQSSFRRLVKEKNLEQIVRFGGIEGLASALNTDVKHGIPGDAEDIAHRHEAFGTNIYRKPPTKSFFHFVWDAFRDPTILILLVCAALSLAFGIKEHGPKQGWYDGGSIFVAVFLFICVSAGSNFRQNRQFDKYSDSKVSNNIPVQVIGDQIPADGLFLDGQSVKVDESSITGESVHAKVNASHNPFLFSGTKVVDGYARMLVTSVGMHTTFGEMMSTINRDSDEQTPLQARLNKLTSSIGKVGLAVAFLVFLVLLVRYFTGNTKDENENREFNGCKMTFDDVINPLVAIVATAVTIVMVAIPEGLQKALTLTIAYSMRSMMADQVMVRKLSAYETMGFATTICTDKTGTLTMNQMNVTKFWLGLECKEERSSTSIAADVLKLLHQGVGLNTTGSVYKPTSGTEFEFSGSPTEKAILSWATLELNMAMEELKQHCTILHAESFNSENKRSGILMRKKLTTQSMCIGKELQR